MRTALVALILISATLTAGCMESISAQLASVRGDENVPQDYVVEVSEVFGPGYARDVALSVEEGATSIRASVRLQAELDGRDSPVVPGQLTVTVVDPSGSVVASRTVDGRSPKATLEVTQFPGFGAWKVRLEGDGLGGNEQGAKYHLTVAVTH